jgi:hypothetical protein
VGSKATQAVERLLAERNLLQVESREHISRDKEVAATQQRQLLFVLQAPFELLDALWLSEHGFDHVIFLGVEVASLMAGLAMNAKGKTWLVAQGVEECLARLVAEPAA